MLIVTHSKWNRGTKNGTNKTTNKMAENVHSRFVIAKNWKESKCLSMAEYLKNHGISIPQKIIQKLLKKEQTVPTTTGFDLKGIMFSGGKKASLKRLYSDSI